MPADDPERLASADPHLHAIVTDGAFKPDGTFIALPELDDEPFEKLWQKKVFDLLLKRGKNVLSVHVEKNTVWSRFNEDKFWKKHNCIFPPGNRAPRRRSVTAWLWLRGPASLPHRS